MRDSLNFDYDDDYAHNEETNHDFYNSKEMNDFTDLGYFICNKLNNVIFFSSGHKLTSSISR